MGIGRFTSLTSIIFTVSLLFSANGLAGDFSDQSGNVFAFQKKLAAKGNVQALYKLGYMYEMGEGADVNIDEAKKNYQAAIAKGYEPATLRMTYLEVKEKGYDKAKHADWLASIKKMSVGSSSEALEANFLLGQLYREGIGVKKDLQKSLEIMYRLSMEGVTEADKEISRIEAESTANLKKKKAVDKKRAEKKAADKKQAQRAAAQRQAKIDAQKAAQEAAKEAARKEAAVKAAAEPASRPASQPAAKAEANPAASAAKTQAVQASAKAAPAVAKTPEEIAKEEKRKRYEAIMKKLAAEQAEINQLQGGVVDDEF